jgi:hypothetical protein
MTGFEQKTETRFINYDPVWGGLIDVLPEDGKWFIMFNNDYFIRETGLASKEEAYAAWEKTVNHYKAYYAKKRLPSISNL